MLRKEEVIMSCFRGSAKSALVLALVVVTIRCSSGFGSSCSFRCNQQPSLLDHMRPIGCYCHNGCGWKFRCCRDKATLCGSRGSSGSQDCMIPATVRNSKIIGGSKLFYRRGDTITYECNFHYVMKRTSRPTRTCFGSNIWSPGPPECEYEIYICRPPQIRNGDYSPKKKQYLNYESARVWCDVGYVLQGPSRITCRTFSWRESTPSCVEDRCRRMTCSADATCKNYRYYSKCICNDGFEGNGYTCTRIPCYKHRCTATENCVDSGLGDGDYSCKCKIGYKREGTICVEDPCVDNDCHHDATCSPARDTYECTCKPSFIGNGTHCQEETTFIDTTASTLEEITSVDTTATTTEDPCVDNDCHENATCSPARDIYECTCKPSFIGNGTHCQERLCDPSTLHTEGVLPSCTECEEICCNATMLRECRICIHTQCNKGEICGAARVPTVCTKLMCFKNTKDGFTVDAPQHVHCLDDNGIQENDMNCCWIGE